MSEVLHGACLCGKVTFDVTQPEGMGVCHCTRCRRWTGSGHSTVVVATPANFKITKGRESLKTYRESKFADRYFCGECGSGIYVDGGANYYVSAGVLKDVKLKPAYHIQVANKEPWDEIGGSAPQYPEYPR
jgi:hypothetical protein